MQVHIDQEVFLQGVTQALGAADRKGSLPILAHCLIQTNGNGLIISATDLEIFFEGHYPGHVAEAGGLAVQANYLNSLLKSLPKSDISLEVGENSRMTVEAGESRYELLGLPVDQFPPPPELPDVEWFEMKGGVLSEMISKTIFSISDESYQQHLHGVFLEKAEVASEPWLRMVSSDGHRLTLVQRQVPGIDRLSLESGIIIPAKAAREISRFLENGDAAASAKVAITDKAMALKAGDKSMFIRLLEKKFPDYGRIIPDGYTYRFMMNRQALVTALKRMTMLSAEKFKGVLFSLTQENLEITFVNPDVGEGRELLAVTSEIFEPEPAEAEEAAAEDEEREAEGEKEPAFPEVPLQVGFNARYLLEPLLAMKGEVVMLEMNDPKRACRIICPNDPHYFGMVMPMDI